MNNSLENKIPPQYKWLSSEIVDDIRTVPYYTDEEKTKQEKERKQRTIEFLQQKEKQEKEAKELEKKLLETENNNFSIFLVKHWETDTGKIWYEYNNLEAKRLKDLWLFKRWEERLYFDISLEAIPLASKIVKEICIENKIPIAFKFLDKEKSRIHDFKDETIFVTNFLNKEDVKKFYTLISKHPDYKNLKGQNKDYDWIKVDQIIHYASWFRETRNALKNIISTAKQNKDTTRTYITLWWKTMTITDKEYQVFLNQYDEQKKKETW